MPVNSPAELAESLGGTQIAIVGLGALYPRSHDVHELWNNIVGGVDCIEDVPETHWLIKDYYDPDPAVADKTYSKRGGFIPETSFDPMEFGIPPNILEVTDILQLLSLIVAKETLRDAGCFDGDWFDASRAGVVLGITGANSIVQPLSARLQTPVIKEVVRSCGLSERDADEIAAKFVKAFPPWQENSFPGALGNVVAGRIANRFNLGGINCTVDAACASSLASVRMAMSELVSGNADLMIAGGCDTENSILTYLCFSKTPAFSKSDNIRPFDEHSDGTLIGEGIGMLALKRLADAERDGDRIYAVLRGIGASSDGRHKSIYAPRWEGQVVALKRAYEAAGFGPDQVGLLECHGTGTPVGDLTELTALRDAYSEVVDEKQIVAIGTVKSQIGHTKGAAGAAGMIKLALALHQKVLPPTINVDQPREAMDFPNSPFYVNTRTMPWIAEPQRPVRRAAVSSFGFGGTNFHCVLEEYRSASGEPSVLHRTTTVHLWHATTVEGLHAAVRAQPAGVDPSEPVPVDHVRMAVVAGGVDELVRLRDVVLAKLDLEPEIDQFELREGGFYRRTGKLPGRVAALFAGQGSQYVGMGAQAAIAVPPVRAAFDSAAAEFADARPLGRVVFPPPAFTAETKTDQENSLRCTDYAQPAIGALAIGQYSYLAALGFAPDGALGHSFGELAALWAAGSITDAEFHRLAMTRGKAMAMRPDDLADAGAMASVRADRGRVAELLVGHDDLVVCNLNAPEDTVVGGGTDALRAFIASCQQAGVTVHQLPVAAAFHTRYVAHAAAEFAAGVAEVDIRDPRIPVYANTESATYGTDVESNRRVLVDQLAKPVSFAPRLEQMYAEGFRIFVEFGPKSVLARLTERTLGDHEDIVVISADRGPGHDGDRTLKQLAARLTVLGLPLNGFNRFNTTTESEPPSKGMTIPLNGVNYVPEERSSAYRDALENGYRVEPTILPSDPVPSEPLKGPTPAVTPPSNGGLAAAHLAMHQEYLSSQLQIADRIAAVLAQETGNGLSGNVVTSINAITEHSIAIGQTHAHASDVLLQFARLEAGDGSHYPGNGRAHSLPSVSAPSVIERSGPSGQQHETIQPRLNITALSTAPQVVHQEPAVPLTQLVSSPQVAIPADKEVVGKPTATVRTTDGTDPEAVRVALLKTVSEKTGYPSEMLDLGMELEAELGIDSIKRVEIMGALRESFPAARAVTPEKLAELRILGDIVDFVARPQADQDADKNVVTDPKEGASSVSRATA